MAVCVYQKCLNFNFFQNILISFVVQEHVFGLYQYNMYQFMKLCGIMTNLRSEASVFRFIFFETNCDAKTLIANKCAKRVLSSVVTHSYMFRPCWVIFRENFFVQRSTQSTAHSHSTITCNLSLMITKKFSLKMTQQGRNM
jgi:hypothetical protein